MPTVSGMGVSVGVPPGWEGRVFRRPPPTPSARAGSSVEAAASQATTHSVTHAASFALPADTGDFGSAAVEVMGPGDVFLTLFEYHPHSAAEPLFQAQGPPRSLSPDAFSPSRLQRPLPGQAGTQVFFSANGRAFCLYVVLGSFANRHRLVPAVNAVLASIDIRPA